MKRPDWAYDVVAKLDRNGITQKELARKLGKTNDYVNQIFCGRYAVKNQETIDKIVNAINEIISERKGEE